MLNILSSEITQYQYRFRKSFYLTILITGIVILCLSILIPLEILVIEDTSFDIKAKKIIFNSQKVFKTPYYTVKFASYTDYPKNYDFEYVCKQHWYFDKFDARYQIQVIFIENNEHISLTLQKILLTKTVWIGEDSYTKTIFDGVIIRIDNPQKNKNYYKLYLPINRKGYFVTFYSKIPYVIIYGEIISFNLIDKITPTYLEQKLTSFFNILSYLR